MSPLIQRSAIWVVLHFLIIFSIQSCKEDNPLHHIRDYYFPLEELSEGMVYEYTSARNDSLAPEYWFYKTFELDSGYYFTGQYYDHEFQVGQFLSEEVIQNGTLLHQLYMYEQDSTGKSIRFPVNIEAANVFPFAVRDSGGIFLYRINWTSPVNPERKTTFIRNRKYTGKHTYTFNDKTFDAVHFDIKELIETEEEGYQEFQYNGEEIYAKGIGLVYYRKEISASMVLEYKLNDRYTMAEFEKKFSGSLLENPQ